MLKKAAAVTALLATIVVTAFVIPPWASSEDSRNQRETRSDFFGDGPLLWPPDRWGLPRFRRDHPPLLPCRRDFEERRDVFLEALAEELDIDIGELKQAVTNVTERFREDAQERFQERLDDAVEDGGLTQGQADRIRRMSSFEWDSDPRTCGRWPTRPPGW
jgi:hypothetical protein